MLRHEGLRASLMKEICRRSSAHSRPWLSCRVRGDTPPWELFLKYFGYVKPIALRDYEEYPEKWDSCQEDGGTWHIPSVRSDQHKRYSIPFQRESLFQGLPISGSLICGGWPPPGRVKRARYFVKPGICPNVGQQFQPTVALFVRQSFQNRDHLAQRLPMKYSPPS